MYHFHLGKNLTLYLFFNEGGVLVLLVAVSHQFSFDGVQPHCVKEGLPTLSGASHQWLGEALCGGAQALRLPIPQ